jgi:hypothetical protein
MPHPPDYAVPNSSIKQARLQWSQIFLLHGKANWHSAFPDGLDHHSSSDSFSNNPDIPYSISVPSDVGRHNAGIWQPG